MFFKYLNFEPTVVNRTCNLLDGAFKQPSSLSLICLVKIKKSNFEIKNKYLGTRLRRKRGLVGPGCPHVRNDGWAASLRG